MGFGKHESTNYKKKILLRLYILIVPYMLFFMWMLSFILTALLADCLIHRLKDSPLQFRICFQHPAPVQAPAAHHGRRPSAAPVLHSGTKFRQGLLQLMIHTIDPLHDGKSFYLFRKKKEIRNGYLMQAKWTRRQLNYTRSRHSKCS